MTDIMPAPSGDTNPALLTPQGYFDAIFELATLAQSSDSPARMVELTTAALKYIAADARSKALAEAVEAARAEHFVGEPSDQYDVGYDRGISDAIAAIGQLTEGGAR